MNRFFTAAAVVGLMSFGATAVEAGQGCGHTYSYGYYGGPAYQAVAPAVPSATAQAPRDGQTFRSFSYGTEPAAPGNVPAAPAYRAYPSYPSYAPSYGMMGPARGMSAPSFYRAGSKMQGRIGR